MAQFFRCDLCGAEISDDGIAIFTRIAKRKVYTPGLGEGPNGTVSDRMEEEKIDMCLDCAEKVKETINNLKKK